MMRHDHIGLIVFALLCLVFVPVADAAPHWEADLTWLAPTGTPTGYEVQRRLGMTGQWETLTIVGAGVLAHRDVGPYQDGQIVCHRVNGQPQNPDGSNVGAESCNGAPVQYPGAVGAPSVQWRWIPN